VIVRKKEGCRVCMVDMYTVALRQRVEVKACLHRESAAGSRHLYGFLVVGRYFDSAML
jgi:hypothetical protein